MKKQAPQTSQPTKPRWVTPRLEKLGTIADVAAGTPGIGQGINNLS